MNLLERFITASGVGKDERTCHVAKDGEDGLLEVADER